MGRLWRRQQAFSLIELAIALAVLGSLTAGVLGIVSLTSERNRYNEAAVSLARVEQALLSFVEENWRLPCPDTSGTETNAGNGIENCAAGGVGRGGVPYRTLGLTQAPLDPWQRPMAYAVDRRFTTLPGPQYRYEFCQRLRAASASLDDSFLHSQPLGIGGTRRNLAYVLLSGGGRDASGDGSRIDQLQSSTSGTDVLLIDDYRDEGVTGDRYVTASLFALAGQLRCPGILMAVNATENEVIAAALTYRNIELSVDIAQGNIDAVGRQITTAALQLVNATATVAAAAATAINAVGQGLVGNAAALASFGGAVVGAAAALASAVAAAIDIAEAIEDKAAMEARLLILQSYLNDVSRVCEAGRVSVDAAKDGVSACP